MSHVTIFERVYFDKSGQPIKWERSYDCKEWSEVYWPGSHLPFVLIKPVETPCWVQTERWESKP